jgi:ABC-type bacteriocin/lantibiotic exporter with double-glycine peptidase domain
MPGKLAVVSGELGSGKSTLLSVLMGLMPPDKGLMLIDGRPAGRDINRVVSVAGAPQRSGFFSTSIKENLCLGFPAAENEMAQALAATALGEIVVDVSKGVERDLGSRGDRLSGGQQQRLALARMFIRKARLNVIDDRVSALDKDTRRELLGQLRKFLR